MMNRLDTWLWEALQEDLEHGDVTAECLIPREARGEAVVFGREPFVLSGVSAFERVFQLMDSSMQTACLFQDGDEIAAGAPVFRLQGNVRSILAGERTVLNILQRLCGVATLTRRMVKALEGLPCRLLDTRKTTPLWRFLEKAAVRHGGGRNHRFSLSDGILIKDNHIAAVGGVKEAVRLARQGAPHTLKVEVEVDTLGQLKDALEAGADVILLDNFTVEKLREAVALNGGRVLLEASGGVTIDTVRAIAETGVHFISCGALTHSARAIDLTMELFPSPHFSAS